MSVLRLSHPSPSAKPVPPGLELRALIDQAQRGERALTAEILRGLRAADLTAFRGEAATATVDLRLEARS